MTTHQNNQFTTQKQEVFFPPNITFKDIGFTLTSAIHPGYGTGRFGRQLILTCLVLIDRNRTLGTKA